MVNRKGTDRPLRAAGGAIYGETLSEVAAAGGLLWNLGTGVVGGAVAGTAQRASSAAKGYVGENQAVTPRTDIGSAFVPGLSWVPWAWYMVVGAHRFGLYALGKGGFAGGVPPIGAKLLHIPRDWVEDFHLERATLYIGGIPIDFIENRFLELEYNRLVMGGRAKKMQAVLGRHH
jgi:hypothetical protein